MSDQLDEITTLEEFQSQTREALSGILAATVKAQADMKGIMDRAPSLDEDAATAIIAVETKRYEKQMEGLSDD